MKTPTPILLMATVVAFLVGLTSGRADYQTEVLAEGPAGYWRLNETDGTTAFDSSGNNRHGTYIDGFTLGAEGALTGGDFAASFDGSSGYVQLPGTWGDVAELTVEAWVYTTEPITGDFQSIVATPDGGFTHFQLHTAGNSGAYTTGGGFVAVPIPPTTPTETWRHVVMVVKSGESGIYVDGVQLGASVGTSFASVLAATFTPGGSRGVRIGNGHVGGRWFKGRIDEVAIYYKALTPERIIAHYIAAVQVGVGIARQPSDATVLEGQTATFTVQAIGAGITYQWFKNGQPINGANASSYTTPPTALADDAAVFRVEVTGPLNSVSSSDAVLTVVARPTGDYQATVVADGPLVFYRFNETSGTAAANLGTLGAAAEGAFADTGVTFSAPAASSVLGTAVDLRRGYIRVPDLAQGGLAQVSIELWVNRRSNPTDFFAIYAGDGFESGDLHWNLVAGGPPVEFAVAGNTPFPRFSPTWGVSEWHHLVVTYDASAGGSSTVKFYLDGKLFGQAESGGTAINFDGGQIGAWLNTFAEPDESQRFLDGSLDEFALYNTVLTPGQILRHFASAAPPPPPYVAAVLADSPAVYYRFEETAGSVAENLGGLGSAANGSFADSGTALGETSAFAGLGKAVRLDGARGFVRVPNLSLGPLAQTTVEFWLKRNTNPGGLLALFAGDGFEPGDLHFNLTGAAPEIEFAVSGNTAYPHFAPPWQINEWHHIVVTYVPAGATSKVRLYVDGVEFGVADASGTPINFTGGQIGAWLNAFAEPDESQRFLNGVIDEFAIYTTALPPARVLAHYAALGETRPTITRQPLDAMAVECQTARFDVNVTGPGLTYQWFKNGALIPGATARTYTTPPVLIADDGAVFRVVASNPVGSVTSEDATLSVIARPSETYASLVMGDAPLVYYRFDETSDSIAANAGSLGLAADGAYNGGVTLGVASARSTLGTAVDLDGASGFIRVPDLAQEPFAQLSVELWFFRRSDPADFFALYAEDGFGQTDLHLNLFGGGALLEYAVSGNPAPYPRYNPGWAIGEWQHLVVTYDTANSELRVYVNGVFQGAAATGTTPVVFNGGQIGAWLNTFEEPDASQRFLNGAIDEFALYHTVLSPEQVLRHYAAVAPVVLNFSRAGGQLTLSWCGTGLVLEQNSSVANGAGWTAVPGGNNSPVTVDASTGTRFYRLRQPQ